MDNISQAPLLMREFLLYLRTIRVKSPRTVTEYFYDLRSFFRFLLRRKGMVPAETPFEEIDISGIDRDLLRSVTLLDLYEYLNFLASERDVSPRSRCRKISCLRSFFKYMTAKAHILDTDPAEQLELPTIRSELPRHLTLEESRRLLTVPNGEFERRDRAILTLFLNCGMRLSELVGIDFSDIRDDTLVVTGKGNKQRTLYLNDACQKALASYLEVRPTNGVRDREAVFLSRQKQRISNSMVQRIVKKYLSVAGLNERLYSTHKLRHTAATLMYQYGDVDLRSLQQILGHEQLTTTQIYTHIDDKKLRSAARANPLSEFEPKKGS